MAKFGLAITPVLKHEGVRFKGGRPVSGYTGYSDDPEDPGGETNYGVTRRVARAAGYRGAMGRIPYATVLAIYRQRYWDKLRLDGVPNQAIAAEMFDTAVNCGVRTSGRFLQETLNACSNCGKRWRRIAEDGKVGPATLRTLKRALRYRPYMGTVILRTLDGLQLARYHRLVTKKKPRLQRYYCGWVLNRVGVRVKA